MKFIIDGEQVKWIVMRKIGSAESQPLGWCWTREEADAFMKANEQDGVIFWRLGVPQFLKTEN